MHSAKIILSPYRFNSEMSLSAVQTPDLISEPLCTGAPRCEGKPPSTVTVKAATFDSEHEFFEALNLFIMWTTALGLGSAICVTSFVQDFVFDTIRVRGYSWQFAAVFFAVVLSHIEDSEGRLNL